MDVGLPKSLQRTLDQAEEHISTIESKWKDFQESNNKASSDSNDPLASSRNDSVRALAIGVLLLTRKRLKGEETVEIEASVEKCKAGLLKMHTNASNSKSSDNKKSSAKKTGNTSSLAQVEAKPKAQSSSSSNNNNNTNLKKKKQKIKA